MTEDISWYQKSVEQVVKELDTDRNGLTAPEARRRLEKYGYNELIIEKHSALMRFLRQFHNPLIYILLAAAITTGLLTITGKDMAADTVVILGVVILNAILGFLQEGKAERSLQALKKLMVHECIVQRDCKHQTIPARDLVPGDVVVLQSGDKIPADLRLFLTMETAVDEALLTGESLPVKKGTDSVSKSGLPPGDQSCMAFCGTFLAKGAAEGIVVGTGEKTEFGKIATLVKKTKKTLTPLQKKIADFTRTLIIAILGIGFVNFVLGWIFGYDLSYSFLASVSLIVAAIPEMLPMIVTAILAFAATTMARRNALIRHLPAAETLGCTTVICADKTGTLTKNEMTVRRIYAGKDKYRVSGVGWEPKGEFTIRDLAVDLSQDHSVLKETLKAGYCCNDSELKSKKGQYSVIGDPTEGALMVSAMKADMEDKPTILDEIPFESELAYMATLHEEDDQNIIYMKGSPEKVISLCTGRQQEEGVEEIDREEIAGVAADMARDALRVLAMAYKHVPKEQTSLDFSDISDFVFLGLQGMIDPPREEAIRAVGQCKEAGVKTDMITGDHALTAVAVAKQLGIMTADDQRVITGEELSRMSDGELEELVDSVSVYARVAPEHKLKIARAIQGKGHIVAMTGDGVNDAPALKAADIGVAMGSGTEVSKEASSMVLADDNFASIVGAVEEGRHAWNNLEKAILYTLPTNGGQALLVMGAILLAPFIPIFAARLPLEPVQILWINLFDSVFLTMPLMMEPKQRDILASPPRDSQVRIANILFLQRVILIGLAIAVPGFLVYYHFGAAAVVNGQIVNPLLLTQAQTAAFWAVLLVHFGFVASARSVYDSAFTFSPFSNKWLLVGILVSILARLLPTFVPAVSSLFRTAEFPLAWWPYILICLLPGFIVLELDKLLRKLAGKRRGNRQ